jgi:hypothetical protein
MFQGIEKCAVVEPARDNFRQQQPGMACLLSTINLHRTLPSF